MSLSRRMADESRLKAKARRTLSRSGEALLDNPRAIGKHYSTHGASCSCYMCGNPRKHFNEPTLSEKISESIELDFEGDCNED